MKRFKLAVALTAAFVLSGAYAREAQAAPPQYVGSLSVTDVNGTKTFTNTPGDDVEFLARSITITASGANTCFLEYTTTLTSATVQAIVPVATVGGIPIASGDSYTINLGDGYLAASGWSGLAGICSAGQTATWAIVANRYEQPNVTVTGGSSAFSGLTSGTNTTAAMLVGTGASFGNTGTGAVSLLDGASWIIGSATATKRARFEVDGFTAANDRAFTLPGTTGDDTIATLANNNVFSSALGPALTITNDLLVGTANQKGVYFGTYAGVNGAFIFSTALTPDSVIRATGTASNSTHLAEYGDVGFDFNNCQAGTSAATDPTLCIQSHNQTTTEWLSLRHDGTNGILDTGVGVVSIPDGGLFPAGTQAAPGVRINSIASGLWQTSAGSVVGVHLTAGSSLDSVAFPAVGSSSGNGVMVRSDGGFKFAPTTANPIAAAPDAGIYRDAAETVLVAGATATARGCVKSNGDANGAYVIQCSATELLTLSTGAATTDTTANLLPADAIIDSVVTRVTTTITTAVSFSVGDPTTAARFSADAAGLTAGSTRVGLDHMSGAVTTLAAGPTQAAAAKVRITLNATPGGGVIRITVFYRQFVAPTS
jgi:hypothetical protein